MTEPRMPPRKSTSGIPPSLWLGLGTAAAVWIVWAAMVGPRMADLFAEQWPVSLTMVFGSFIAGASSEGGGAVAFPVFTKVLGVAPADARLFALAIQSVGMTAAAFSIIAMRVRIDWRVIGWATLGGSAGLLVGLFAVAPVAPPAEVKMFFTAMQASFALVLIVSMRRPGARAQSARLPTGIGPACLVAAGFAGGVASGLVGSGIDLVIFSTMVLLFRMSEKVATPTSVVLMALHSLLAMAAYLMQAGALPSAVYQMWLAAVPVVVVGAPVGAWVCSHLSRETIAWSLVALISVEVATSLWLIPLGPRVLLVSLGALGCFLGLFAFMLRCKEFDPSFLRSRRRANPADDPSRAELAGLR